MSQIVSTESQVNDNIRRFPSELKRSRALRDRLAYARAWYAVPGQGGDWMFGPSKFVGYQGMTAEEYLNDEPLNGRRTESQLSQWFKIVDVNDDIYQELSTQLVAFLERFGKVPSKSMRINISRNSDLTLEEKQTSAIVDLILAVAKSLPRSDVERLKRSL